MMLDHALELARSGWAVFPCQPAGEQAKAPFPGGRGHLDASTDRERIRRWWSRWPAAMIGAPVPAGLLVLDIDPRNGGDLAQLVAVTGPLPPTLTVWSGREDGGRHLYFRVRPDLALTSTRLPGGVDLKRNGYCILPPSLHPATGRAYRWDGTSAAVLPVRAVRALMPAPVPKPSRTGIVGGNGAGLVRTVAEAEPGNRNRALFWAARAAAEDGLLDQLEPGLTAAARGIGLGDPEIRRTIASAARAVVA